VTELPDPQASRTLSDCIGEMTEEQALRILAIFNRYWCSADETRHDEAPDSRDVPSRVTRVINREPQRRHEADD
jgi:hypothetical protein